MRAEVYSKVTDTCSVGAERGVFQQKFEPFRNLNFCVQTKLSRPNNLITN
jgi:hypothetical protein